MSRLNDPGNFAGRVAYAASVIANGRPTSRAFDNCFENYDGDEVSAILVRRAAKNSKLAANIWRYLNQEFVTERIARFANVPTRQIPLLAAESRREAEIRFRERIAETENRGT
jgi:hypothetical protein